MNKSSKKYYFIYPALFFCLLLFALFRIGANIPEITPAEVGLNADTSWRSTIETLVKQKILTKGVPGISFGFVNNGSFSGSINSGKTSMFFGSDVDEKTIFEAASLTKPLTAWGVMKLVEQKKLSLDSIIITKGYRYTVKQLLSHTAGFNNQLGAIIQPQKQAGEFLYSGQGYMKLAELIEQTSGLSFEKYMNEYILKELGMTNSFFGPLSKNEKFASPHISIVVPVLLGCFVYLIIFFLLLGIIRLIKKQFFYNAIADYLLSIALLASLLLPFVFLNSGNGLRFAVVNLLVFSTFILIRWGMKKQDNESVGKKLAKKVVSMVLSLLIIGSVFFHMPVPLEKRKAIFLPAAGLKTTAHDYSLFLIQLMAQCKQDSLFKQMIDNQVDVNNHYAWGLGIGIQKSNEKMIWHWGVNFPGYQSFFLAWPEKEESVVVFMNGGPMYLTPNGYRFGGLELARDIISKIYRGNYHGYWQEIQ